MSAKILIISGSDLSGESGYQIDYKTANYFNIEVISVLTALTIQNSKSVDKIEFIKPSVISQQIEFALRNFSIKAIKIGMLGQKKIAEAVFKSLAKTNIPIILDPVLLSSSGAILFEKAGIETLLANLKNIYCLTPNLPELESLTGIKINSENDIKESAAKILNLGLKNIIIKGGHSYTENITDILLGEFNHIIKNKRYNFEIRGTGCRFATALTCQIIKEENLVISFKRANQYLQKIYQEHM